MTKLVKTYKKNKLLKATSIVLFTAIVLAAAIFIILFQAAKSMGIGTKSVADYEKRIEIWNTPA